MKVLIKLLMTLISFTASFNILFMVSLYMLLSQGIYISLAPWLGPEIIIKTLASVVNVCLIAT